MVLLSSLDTITCIVRLPACNLHDLLYSPHCLLPQIYAWRCTQTLLAPILSAIHMALIAVSCHRKLADHCGYFGYNTHPQHKQFIGKSQWLCCMAHHMKASTLHHLTASALHDSISITALALLHMTACMQCRWDTDWRPLAAQRGQASDAMFRCKVTQHEMAQHKKVFREFTNLFGGVYLLKIANA